MKVVAPFVRVFGKLLMWLGHFALAALAVLVPCAFAMRLADPLPILGAGAAALLAAFVLVIGGDRLAHALRRRPKPRRHVAHGY
jgi:hypothetical protein